MLKFIIFNRSKNEKTYLYRKTTISNKCKDKTEWSTVVGRVQEREQTSLSTII